VRMDGLVHPLRLGDAAQELGPEVVFHVNRLVPAKRDGPTYTVSSIRPCGSRRPRGSRRPIRSLRPLRPLRSRRPGGARLSVSAVVTASRLPWKSGKSRKIRESSKTTHIS
jgi:hypothetical protein